MHKLQLFLFDFQEEFRKKSSQYIASLHEYACNECLFALDILSFVMLFLRFIYFKKILTRKGVRRGIVEFSFNYETRKLREFHDPTSDPLPPRSSIFYKS